MTRAMPFLAIAIIFAWVPIARAEAVVGNDFTPYAVFGGGHASTAAEGYANGMSTHSIGRLYNLQTSQAAINAEQARSMNLDNRLKGTQTYFEMRKVNTASRKSGRRFRNVDRGLLAVCPNVRAETADADAA